MSDARKSSAFQHAEPGLLQASRFLPRRELQERVARGAGGFAALGLGAGDTVAILMRNDIAFLEASLAATRIGAYAVPINWHATPQEIDYIVKDSGARALVGHDDLLAPLGPDILSGIAVFPVETPPDLVAAFRLPPGDPSALAQALRWEEWLEAQRPYEGAARPVAQSMLYTSGTTGVPKGVRRFAPTPDQRRLMDVTRQTVYGVTPGARILIPGPLYHGAPNGVAIAAAAVADLLLIMPRFDPERLLALIEAHRIDCLFMVPTMFVRLLALPEEVRGRYDLSSLRFVLHAAAPCPLDVKRRMIEWWGPVINEFYGGTESGPIAFCSSADWLQKPGTVGRLVEGATVRILDETGNECAPGVPGEIYARLGHYPDFTYHGQDQKRREIERDGLVTLGDVGYRDEAGYLFLCDRKRDMVIIGGANVYPAEIESVLGGMPGVKDCAVFGIPDAEYGEALIALVEPHCRDSIRSENVHEFLRTRLSGFKLPHRVEIRESLPREDSGKILKRLLRAPYWKQAGRQI